MAKKKYITAYVVIHGKGIHLRFTDKDVYHIFCESVFQYDHVMLGCEYEDGRQIMLRPASVDLFRRTN